MLYKRIEQYNVNLPLAMFSFWNVSFYQVIVPISKIDEIGARKISRSLMYDSSNLSISLGEVWGPTKK